MSGGRRRRREEENDMVRRGDGKGEGLGGVGWEEEDGRRKRGK